MVLVTVVVAVCSTNHYCTVMATSGRVVSVAREYLPALALARASLQSDSLHWDDVLEVSVGW